MVSSFHHFSCFQAYSLTRLGAAAECIYSRHWQPRPSSTGFKLRPAPGSGLVHTAQTTLSVEDDAKLVFGVVFSLRNMVRKLGGDDDRYGVIMLL